MLRIAIITQESFRNVEFALTMKTMQEIVFNWPDKNIFFPDHGLWGRIGDELPARKYILSERGLLDAP